MEGLRVKARAACWARLGDLDPASGSTTDERMALPIIRDLIRLFDPNLEQPGALQTYREDLKRSSNEDRLDPSCTSLNELCLGANCCFRIPRSTRSAGGQKASSGHRRAAMT